MLCEAVLLTGSLCMYVSVSVCVCVQDNHSYYFSVIRYIPYTIDKYFVLLHQLHSADMLNSWHRKVRVIVG